MPYIRTGRTLIDQGINNLIRTGALGDWTEIGEINYLITKILLATLPKNYRDYNALIGVLECCKLEFYRRAVAAYEDEKIKKNGDVY